MDMNQLIASNAAWAAQRRAGDPSFFPRLAAGQSPRSLWIGCADSRVAPELWTGRGPGELFVHRNVANVVSAGDANLMAVVEFAVDHLKVGHIYVSGHEACGGVTAALDGGVGGVIDRWIAPIMDLAEDHAAELTGIPDREDRIHRLVELNVAEQVQQLAHSATVQAAWRRGQDLTVHGIVFHLSSGLVTDLEVSRSG